MASKVVLDVTVERGGGVDAVQLIIAALGTTYSQELTVHLIDNKGAFVAVAPGRYALVWYLRGSPGSSMKVVISSDAEEILVVTPAKTKIRPGTPENFGTRVFELKEPA